MNIKLLFINIVLNYFFQKMKITFDYKYFHKPFSYIVCDDFLSVNDQNKIIEEIKELKTLLRLTK